MNKTFLDECFKAQIIHLIFFLDMKKVIALAICVIALVAVTLLDVSLNGVLSVKWAPMSDIIRHISYFVMLACAFYFGYKMGKGKKESE